MGQAYESAILRCLEGDFHITQDDVRGSELARKFESQVLRLLETGKDLDGVG
jgi:hypothetical protein